MKENTQEKVNNIQRQNFINLLKSDVLLIQLQKKLKTGEIGIKDLSKKEKTDMIDLYRKQIDEKKNKLSNINKKILFCEKRIKDM